MTTTTQKTLIEQLQAQNDLLTQRVEALEETLKTHLESHPQPRDRGPKSERKMTEDDARRIMLGDLKDAPHKEAAEALGLSYGQVYSARFGFTFKKVYKEADQANYYSS